MFGSPSNFSTTSKKSSNKINTKKKKVWPFHYPKTPPNSIAEPSRQVPKLTISQFFTKQKTQIDWGNKSKNILLHSPRTPLTTLHSSPMLHSIIRVTLSEWSGTAISFQLYASIYSCLRLLISFASCLQVWPNVYVNDKSKQKKD